MSDQAVIPTQDHSTVRSRRGQSLVEFALVLPMLLVLLLGIADFARIFSAGIILEASARNAAELGAIERLRNEPATPADSAYYTALHRAAADAACAEGRRLPTFNSPPENCPDGAHDNSGATSWFVRVCVHDGADPACGSPPPAPQGYSAMLPPDDCDSLKQPMSNAVAQAVASYYVEVRVCYKFETLFNLDLALPLNAGISLGDIWLERTRTFVIDCPVGIDPSDLAANCPNP